MSTDSRRLSFWHKGQNLRSLYCYDRQAKDSQVSGRDVQCPYCDSVPGQQLIDERFVCCHSHLSTGAKNVSLDSVCTYSARLGDSIEKRAIRGELQY